MTELSDMPVDNGERVEVTSAVYTGTAGVRRTERGGDFAFLYSPPTSRRARFNADPVATMAAELSQNRSATVDGRPAEILTVRRSDVSAGIVLARFVFVGAE